MGARAELLAGMQLTRSNLNRIDYVRSRSDRQIVPYVFEVRPTRHLRRVSATGDKLNSKSTKRGELVLACMTGAFAF